MAVVGGPESEYGVAARAEVQVSTTSLSDAVEAMLQAAGPGLRDHDLLVLPPYQRDGYSLYGSADVDAVRLARKAGLDAAFLHGAEAREYLHEYSAGWAVEFAIALSAHVAAINLISLGSYVIARARKAVDEGLHAGPVEDVPIRITVAYFHRDADGSETLKDLRIEGPTAAAAEMLSTLVRSDFQEALSRSVSDETHHDGREPSPVKEISNEQSVE